MQNTIGKQKLHRQLHRLLFGMLAPLQAKFVSLDLKRVRYGAAQAFGLGEGCDDRAKFGNVDGALGHCRECHTAFDAHPDVLSDTGSVLPQSGPHSTELPARQCGVDTQTCLDHHAHLIDHVGEFSTDCRISFVDASLEKHIRNDETAGAPEDDEQDADKGEVHEEQDEARQPDGEQQFDGQESVNRPANRRAGAGELLLRAS